ncbi:MAG: hypothetical protein IJG33_03175 [Selenomonadaceae bacterium]|nr:hypothetical protein [Selenomonadaceae bacterium]
MTEQELNSVRELKKRIHVLEKHLQALRLSAENIVPVLDGLPHSTEAKSRVEKIALMIVEDERELTALNEKILLAKSELVDKILCQVDEPTLQTLLILRYVECLSFKETARRMHFTLRHIFKLHEKILKEFICWHIAAQNTS